MLPYEFPDTQAMPFAEVFLRILTAYGVVCLGVISKSSGLPISLAFPHDDFMITSGDVLLCLRANLRPCSNSLFISPVWQQTLHTSRTRNSYRSDRFCFIVGMAPLLITPPSLHHRTASHSARSTSPINTPSFSSSSPTTLPHGLTIMLCPYAT